MKTITISTENSETYSSVSNFFIDYYMTEANGDFVKVYLYLVRLLSRQSAITVADIADHFNLTEKDICRAIKYWITRDVLKLNYDGNGNLSGIVLLPLNPPLDTGKLTSDAISILRSEPQPVLEKNNIRALPVSSMNQPSVAGSAVERDAVELTAPPKPKFTKASMDDKLLDEDWADIMYQVETLFGKTLSSRDTETLLYIYDTLQFDVDLLEYLIEYCTTMGKKSCHYMEAVAIAWYKDGIKTRAQAKEQASITSGVAKIVFHALGIRKRYPSNVETAYFNQWTKDFGFSPELIECACNKAIISQPSSANLPYINGILENWHKKGVKTLKDVEELDKAFANKAPSSPARMAKVSNGFNNFAQTKMDDALDEMEQLLLKEVNN